MTPLEIASWLVMQRECSVIPIDHPGDTNQTDPKRVGKVPRLVSWKMFQETRPTPDNLRHWFGHDPRNIGIVTGAVSQLVAVDCDSAEAVTWADTHLPPTPMATQTARGEHRFYRYPGTPVGNTVRLRTGDPDIKIDVRGDGGFVVGPGSVHASGAVYQRLGTWPPIADLPVFDPAWLAPESADPRDEMPRPPAGSGVTPRQTSDAHVLSRARAYVAAVPRAIEGQGGDTHTFAVVCAVVRGFDLSDSDALDVLREWNERCLPPWSDRSLAAKIDGARKYGDEPIGARRDAPRPTSTQVKRDVSPATNGAEAAVSPALAFVSVGDLLAEPDDVVEWIVEDRIPFGGVVLLAAKPKAGKSTTGRSLAVRVARGEPWLGSRTRAGRVWLLALEERRADVKAHLRRMGATADDTIDVLFDAGPGRLDKLHALADARRPDLIIVDTVIKVLPRGIDLNDYAAVSAAMAPLLDLARKTGAALLLLHHTTKAGQGLDSVLGSTALTGSADNILLLERTRENLRVLSSVQRVGPDLEPVVVTLDEAGHVHLAGSRRDVEAETLALDLANAMEAAAAVLTEPEALDLVEARSGEKRSALRRLVTDGTVIRVGNGKRGDPYRYAHARFSFLVPIQDGNELFDPSPDASTPTATESDSRSRCSPRSETSAQPGTSNAEVPR